MSKFFNSFIVKWERCCNILPVQESTFAVLSPASQTTSIAVQYDVYWVSQKRRSGFNLLSLLPVDMNRNIVAFFNFLWFQEGHSTHSLSPENKLNESKCGFSIFSVSYFFWVTLYTVFHRPSQLCFNCRKLFWKSQLVLNDLSNRTNLHSMMMTATLVSKEQTKPMDPCLRL